MAEFPPHYDELKTCLGRIRPDAVVTCHEVEGGHRVRCYWENGHQLDFELQGDTVHFAGLTTVCGPRREDDLETWHRITSDLVPFLQRRYGVRRLTRHRNYVLDDHVRGHDEFVETADGLMTWELQPKETT